MRWLLTLSAALAVCCGVVRGGDGFLEESPDVGAAVAERFEALMQASDFEAAAALAYDPLETAGIEDSQTWRDLWAVFYDTRSHALIYDRQPDRREQMRRVRDRIFEMMLDSPDWNTVNSVGPAFVALSIGMDDTERIHFAFPSLNDRSAARLERIMLVHDLPDLVTHRWNGAENWIRHTIQMHQAYVRVHTHPEKHRDFMLEIAIGDIAAMYGSFLRLHRNEDARAVAEHAQAQYDDPLVRLVLMQHTPLSNVPPWTGAWIAELDAMIPKYESKPNREAFVTRAMFEQVRRPLLEALTREDQPEPSASPSPAHRGEAGEREER